jgi:hypothetical protein
MAGLVPAIHVLVEVQVVNAPRKAGCDIGMLLENVNA